MARIQIYRKIKWKLKTDLGFNSADCYLMRSMSYEKLGLKDNAKQDQTKYEKIKMETDKKKKYSSQSSNL